MSDFNAKELVDVADLYRGLSQLAAVQRVVSGQIAHAVDGSRRSIADYSFALTEEVHELARELEWRPWRAPRVPDRARVVEEFADVLAFLGVMLATSAVALGVDSDELALAIAEEYARVTEKNYFKLQKYKGSGG